MFGRLERASLFAPKPGRGFIAQGAGHIDRPSAFIRIRLRDRNKSVYLQLNKLKVEQF